MPSKIMRKFFPHPSGVFPKFLFIAVFSIVMAVLPGSSVRGEQGLALKINGDPANGYTVSILYQGQMISSSAGVGEFSARFQNGSRELDVPLRNWKATSWTGNAQHLVLTGLTKLEDLKTDLSVRVDYDLLSPHVVRKRIELRQVDAHLLYYQVTNSLQPSASPAKFWSF